MGDVVLPWLAHEGDRPARHAEIDLQEEHAADAGNLHRMQVRLHLLSVLIAIHEIPIDARAGRVRRAEKFLFQSFGWNCWNRRQSGK